MQEGCITISMWGSRDFLLYHHESAVNMYVVYFHDSYKRQREFWWIEQLLAADCEVTMHAVAVQGTQIRKGSQRNKEALVIIDDGVWCCCAANLTVPIV